MLSLIYRQLLDYLSKEYKNKEIIFEIIDRLFISHLFKDYFPEKRKEIQQAKCKMFIKCQNNINQYKELYSAFAKSGIDFCILKGIPFTYDLFHNIYQRYSDDIDVLIEKRDISMACIVLGHLGYKVNGEIPTAQTPENDYMLAYGNHHMFPFLKIENNIINGIELHTFPYPHTSFDFEDYSLNNNYAKEVFDRKEQILINHIPFNQLEFHDRLIQYMLHYSTHLLNDFRDYIYFGHIVEMKYDLLLFIALFIKKYESIIDWDIITQRCNLLKICPDILICITHLKEIFPSLRIVSNFDFHSYSEGDIVRRLITVFTSHTIKDYINKDIYLDFLKHWNEFRKNNCISILISENLNKWIALGEISKNYFSIRNSNITFKIPYFQINKVDMTGNHFLTSGIHIFIFDLDNVLEPTSALSVININDRLELVDTVSFFNNQPVKHSLTNEDYIITCDSEYIYTTIDLSLFPKDRFGIGIKVHRDQFFNYQLDCPTVNHILLIQEGGENNDMVNA